MLSSSLICYILEFLSLRNPLVAEFAVIVLDKLRSEYSELPDHMTVNQHHGCQRRRCLLLFYESKRHHIGIKCVHQTSDRRTWCQYDFVLMLIVVSRILERLLCIFPWGSFFIRYLFELDNIFEAMFIHKRLVWYQCTKFPLYSGTNIFFLLSHFVFSFLLGDALPCVTYE